MSAEEWRPVVGLQGYEVSSLGRVRSQNAIVPGGPTKALRQRKGRMLKPIIRNGYPSVNLFRDKTAAGTSYIHRLVLEAFIGECPVGMEACHNDGDRMNCRCDNLRWGTHRDNEADKGAHNTRLNGERCPWAKLTAAQVDVVRKNRVGETSQELASRYGVSPSTIRAIWAGANWRQTQENNCEHELST